MNRLFLQKIQSVYKNIKEVGRPILLPKGDNVPSIYVHAYVCTYVCIFNRNEIILELLFSDPFFQLDSCLGGQSRRYRSTSCF